MSVFDLEALKREYAASDERGDAKFTIDFYDMTIVLERLEQAEQAVARVRGLIPDDLDIQKVFWVHSDDLNRALDGESNE